MTATNNFFIWFFTGLNGLGGWFIFLLLALASVIWMFYDSSKRRLPALGWRLGAILLLVLLVPATIYRFSSVETQLSLAPFVETIFYIGLLGGILSVALAVGYYFTYRGLVGCPSGHVYDSALGECPECKLKFVPTPAPPFRHPGPIVGGGVTVSPPAPRKPKASAWLVSENGHSYQLCVNETTIGRSEKNDIHLSGSMGVSREHARITESNGRFYIFDLDSAQGTRVNNQVVRQKTLLEPDDEVQFGDHAKMRFVTSK